MSGRPLDPLRVGFAGLGAMGAPMARRLLDAGHELTVWNRTPARAEPLAAAGARVAATPREAAAAADVVVTMVADGAALETVAGGADGILAGLRRGSLLVDMSTVGPDAVRRLAGRVPTGASFLDAPVLGSVDEARAGTLLIFVGGDEPAFSRADPLLRSLGEPRRAGPVGSGAAAKLVANSTLLAAVAGVAEALALGAALGLAREDVFAVLAATPLAAQAERRRPAVERGEYPRRFALALARKDAELVVEAGARRGLELRLAAGVRDALAEAEAAGWGDRDYSALIGLLLERADGAGAPS